MAEKSENGSGGAKAFGGVMAVFGIIGVISAVIFGVSGQANERIDQLERRVTVHDSIAWHAKAAETVPSIITRQALEDERIRELDIKLQQEIEAANAITSERLTGLDTALQREIKALEKHLQAVVAALDRVGVMERANLSKHIIDTDIALQREIAALQSLLESEMRKLDEKLQIEFGKTGGSQG